jgi:hypothetical protein
VDRNRFLRKFIDVYLSLKSTLLLVGLRRAVRCSGSGRACPGLLPRRWRCVEWPPAWRTALQDWSPPVHHLFCWAPSSFHCSKSLVGPRCLAANGLAPCPARSLVGSSGIRQKWPHVGRQNVTTDEGCSFKGRRS